MGDMGWHVQLDRHSALEEITYPFLNFNDYKQFHTTLYTSCNCLPMQGLKVNRVGKMDLLCLFAYWCPYCRDDKGPFLLM